MNMEAVKSLFEDWQDSLILSCLQGYMGTLIVDDEENPASALIDVGDFCFLTGKPSIKLLENFTGNKILTPHDIDWETLIEQYYGNQVYKFQRYAIKKEPNGFDRKKLQGFVDALDEAYQLRIFDQVLFEMAKNHTWSIDLVANFRSVEDYQGQGIGIGILHDGELVAAAAPYGIYRGGMEIEIDTKPEYRERGLATVCGAKVILECLQRNLYPSWDAHDLRSVALAEKLGYHLKQPYTAYELKAK